MNGAGELPGIDRRHGGLRSHAWALDVRKDALSVHAGASVEIRDNFLAEGAWMGDFTAEGLLSSAFRCSTGAVFKTGHVILVPPSHSLESLYCFVGREYVRASNSIQLLVALTPEAAPGDFDLPHANAHTLTKGRINYERVLYRNPSGAMLRIAFGPLTIDQNNLSVTEDVRLARAASDFASFEGYRALLSSTLREVVQNAQDGRRIHPYGELITTCSSGYDSTACAVLARELGCRESLTLRSGRGGHADSGKAVSEQLGLSCHEYERVGSLHEGEGTNGDFIGAEHLCDQDADFLSSVNTCEDMYFAAFEPHLHGRVLLTGFHGDSVWCGGCPSGPAIARGDFSGSGIDEFRKRVGFVHVPVPFIGVENHSVLASLYEADEMAPFSVDGWYNRPVPRRIAEEAGVERASFGVRKLAGSLLISSAGGQPWVAFPERTDAFFRLVAEYQQAVSGLEPLVRTTRRSGGGLLSSPPALWV